VDRELDHLDQLPASCPGVSLVLSYGIYAGFAILAFIFVLTNIKETKGRTLESM